MTDTTPSDASTLIGEVVGGRYAIERVLGEGSMGIVFLAEHVHMKKKVAVKVLKSAFTTNLEAVARFEREAQAAGHIDHPNVCAATDFGRLDDERFFLVMEYIEGETLGDLVKREGRLSPQRTVAIVRQIASALQRAHELDVIHRDLKPENVLLLHRDGIEDFVKITDFGVARVEVVTAQNLTRAGTTMGTPVYMSPEQATASRTDGRSDLYTLGVIMFELLTGRVPFYSDSLAVLLSQHAVEPPPALGDVAPEAALPPDLVAIVDRLLLKSPDERYASAAELIEALDAADLTVVEETMSATIADVAPAAAAESSGSALGGIVKVMAAPVIALILFGIAMVVLLPDPNQAPPAVEVAAEQTPTLEEERARFLVDAGLHEAYAQMAPADAAARLAGAETGEASRGHARYLQARALVEADAAADAMAIYAEAIDADPRYATEPTVLHDVASLFANKTDTTAAPAVALMARLVAEPESGALPLLLDIAYEGHWNARKRSRDLLKSAEQWESLQQWQRDAIDLGLVTRSQCERGASLARSLAEAGAPGALPALRAAAERPTKGCGFLKRGDCYRCMRVPVRDAIATLEQVPSD